MFRERFWATITLILFMLWIVFRAPWSIFLITGMVLIFFALREFYRMMDLKGYHPLLFFGTFLGLTIYMVQFISSYLPMQSLNFALLDLCIFFMIFGCLLIILSRYKQVKPIACMGATISGVFYIAWPFSMLLKIRYFSGVDGSVFLFFLILVSKATDITAYLVGSKWGKRKLIPEISPGKTIEGAWGGMIGSVLVAAMLFIIFGHRMDPLNWKDVILLGVFIGFFSQIGDVVESLMKRDTGIKDSSSLIPGVGGVLDLLDSLLLTGPLMYFYMLARI